MRSSALLPAPEFPAFCAANRANKSFRQRSAVLLMETDGASENCHRASSFRSSRNRTVGGWSLLSGIVTDIVAGQKRFVKSFFEKTEKIFSVLTEVQIHGAQG